MPARNAGVTRRSGQRFSETISFVTSLKFGSDPSLSEGALFLMLASSK
jgi:hypothetical protein